MSRTKSNPSPRSVLKYGYSQKIEGQALQRRNAELEVENRTLQRRLQRAELILEIQKNAAGLLWIELKGPDSRESD
jgi:hypothetical protein